MRTMYNTFRILLIVLVAINVISCKNEEPKEEITFYHVGDYYHVGSEEGIIYKVVTLSGGMYAMAISLDEAQLVWSTEMIRTGATDTESGYKNQQVIQKITDWQTKYPAFKWCADKNTNGATGWYLPSAEEMKEIYYLRIEDEETGKTVLLNDYLVKHGGTVLAEPEEYSIAPYWTSTETNYSEENAFTPNYDKYGTSVAYDKTTVRRVRAIKYIRIY